MLLSYDHNTAGWNLTSLRNIISQFLCHGWGWVLWRGPKIKILWRLGGRRMDLGGCLACWTSPDNALTSEWAVSGKALTSGWDVARPDGRMETITCWAGSGVAAAGVELRAAWVATERWRGGGAVDDDVKPRLSQRHGGMLDGSPEPQLSYFQGSEFTEASSSASPRPRAEILSPEEPVHPHKKHL